MIMGLREYKSLSPHYPELEERMERMCVTLKERGDEHGSRVLRSAYYYANYHHREDKRKSGEPYISHPLAVAEILAQYRADYPSLVAAVLHDVYEDHPNEAPLEDIASLFGDRVAALIDGLTKVSSASQGLRSAARIKISYTDGDDSSAHQEGEPGSEASASAQPLSSQIDLVSNTISNLLANASEGVMADVIFDQQAKEAKIADKYSTTRKLFCTIIEHKEARVILVKLCDRLHNMTTLSNLRADKQERIANETLEIYAPIADRLGVRVLKLKLEELCFEARARLALDPSNYQNLSSDGDWSAKVYMKMAQDYKRFIEDLETERRRRWDNLSATCRGIEEKLRESGMDFEMRIESRHLYSIYNQLGEGRYSRDRLLALNDLDFLVVVVDKCYAALGIIQQAFRPYEGSLRDYIAVKKTNGYSALHVLLHGAGGLCVSVHIATKEQDDVNMFGIMAELYGVSLHGAISDAYKPNIGPAKQLDNFTNWINYLTKLDQDARDNDKGFVNNVRADCLTEQVYVFTPEGETVSLPMGSTPIDFAYRIHTDVGNCCTEARINNRPESLTDYSISNGDTIAIITAPGAQPQRSWFDSCKTRSAKGVMARFFRAQSDEENRRQGLQRLHKMMDAAPKFKMWKGCDKFLDKLVEYLALGIPKLSAGANGGVRASASVAKDEVLLQLGTCQIPTEVLKRAIAVALQNLLAEYGDLSADPVRVSFGFKANLEYVWGLPPEMQSYLDAANLLLLEYHVAFRPEANNAECRIILQAGYSSPDFATIKRCLSKVPGLSEVRRLC